MPARRATLPVPHQPTPEDYAAARHALEAVEAYRSLVTPLIADYQLIATLSPDQSRRHAVTCSEQVPHSVTAHVRAARARLMPLLPPALERCRERLGALAADTAWPTPGFAIGSRLTPGPVLRVTIDDVDVAGRSDEHRLARVAMIARMARGAEAADQGGAPAQHHGFIFKHKGRYRSGCFWTLSFEAAVRLHLHRAALRALARFRTAPRTPVPLSAPRDQDPDAWDAAVAAVLAGEPPDSALRILAPIPARPDRQRHRAA